MEISIFEIYVHNKFKISRYKGKVKSISIYYWYVKLCKICNLINMSTEKIYETGVPKSPLEDL